MSAKRTNQRPADPALFSVRHGQYFYWQTARLLSSANLRQQRLFSHSFFVHLIKNTYIHYRLCKSSRRSFDRTALSFIRANKSTHSFRLPGKPYIATIVPVGNRRARNPYTYQQEQIAPSQASLSTPSNNVQHQPASAHPANPPRNQHHRSKRLWYFFSPSPPITPKHPLTSTLNSNNLVPPPHQTAQHPLLPTLPPLHRSILPPRPPLPIPQPRPFALHNRKTPRPLLQQIRRPHPRPPHLCALVRRLRRAGRSRKWIRVLLRIEVR